MDNKNNFDAVLLDFDGTFADTGEGIFYCIRTTLDTMKKPQISDAAVRTFIGPPLHESFRRECGFTSEEADTALKIYRPIYESSAYKLLSVYQGVPELIAELKANGKKVGIASAKPEKFLIKILEFLGMENTFDTVAGIGMSVIDSSKVKIVSRAADALGVDRERILMVGDRFYDVDGAHGAGLKCAGVLYGYGSREELETAGADYIAETPAEILDIVL